MVELAGYRSWKSRRCRNLDPNSKILHHFEAEKLPKIGHLKIFLYDDKENQETKLKVKHKSQVQEIWSIFWLNTLENYFHASICTFWKKN